MWLKNKNILLFCIFNFLIIGATHQLVFYELLSEWSSSGPYNHGLLGFSLSMYCFWLKRHHFQPEKINILTIVFFIAMLLLLLIADLASLGQLQQLSLFLIFIALLTCLYGFNILQKLFLPLMILAFTLPIWSMLQIPLREISTWVSFTVIEQLHFIIRREDYHLITPGGIFVVEEACSGLGFFLVSALYATLIIQLNKLPIRAAWIFFSFAITIAIVANWIRIIAIVIIGSQTQMQHFVVQDHLTFGWFVFAICYLPIIFAGSKHLKNDLHNKQKSDNLNRQNGVITPVYLVFLSLLMLIINSFYFIISSRFEPHYQFELPTIDNYQKMANTQLKNPNWFPTYPGASSQQFNYFLQDETLLQVYVVNYVYQQQGSELINVENQLFESARWPIQQAQKITIEHEIKTINLLSLRKNKQRSRLITYWYFIDGKLMSTKKQAKWASFTSTLKGTPGASLVAIALDYPYQNQQQAKQKIIDFSLTLIKSIQ